MSAEDVALILGKSVAWVSKQATKGQFPHLKVGRDLRFTEDHITAYLAAISPAKPVEASNDWGRKKRGA